MNTSWEKCWFENSFEDWTSTNSHRHQNCFCQLCVCALTGIHPFHLEVSWGSWATEPNLRLQMSAPSCGGQYAKTFTKDRYKITKHPCWCVCYLTGLLLRETRRDSRQPSSWVSLGSVFSSWIYITADLELSFWFWPCVSTQTYTAWYSQPDKTKMISIL